jgi:branched-chain amino acid aminotransferase
LQVATGWSKTWTFFEGAWHEGNIGKTVATEEWVRLARVGIQRFDKDAALYIRPMYWGEIRRDRGCKRMIPSPHDGVCRSTRRRCVRPLVSRLRYRPIAAQRSRQCRSTPKRDACSRTTPGRCLRYTRAAKDGVVFTPILLRQSGVNVVEKTLSYQDFEKADEIFATGNYSNVVPVTRIRDHTLPFGPIYTKARELYWSFAHS